jgi:hypothetical protein
MDVSAEDSRVWRYLVENPTAEAGDVAVNCAVSLETAQHFIDRIGTPREVFEAEQRRATVKPTRVQTLETAAHLTGGDRDKSYGPPYDNLSSCAALWSAYANSKWGCLTQAADGSYTVTFTAEDVAWLMVLVKMTRSFYPGYHPDNYTDAAAFSAIAGECRELQTEENKTCR